jgi:hypothetical protein
LSSLPESALPNFTIPPKELFFSVFFKSGMGVV